MGFFDFLKETEFEAPEKSIDNVNDENRAMGISMDSPFGLNNTLTEDDLLKIPTVQACLEIICSVGAQLPIYLYRENSDGSIERVFNDKREYLLNFEPNEFCNAYNFKKNLIKDYLIHGSAYSFIEKEKNTNNIESMHYLDSEKIVIKKYKKQGYKIADADICYYDEESYMDAINYGKSEDCVKFKPYELFISLRDSKDGLTSKGILHHGQELFKNTLSEMEYVGSIYNNSALPLGTLKTSGRLTEAAITKLRNSWRDLYSGSKNAGKTVILEEGLEYAPISLNPKDLSVNDNRKSNISDICKLFNLPESLVNSSANKYGSVEQNNIHFLQYTLSPILTAIENGATKSLLTEEEKKNGHFWAFDTNEVLKTTEKEKYESIKVALDSGVVSLNEARYTLNLPTINDNIMKWSLGSVLYYPETGEMKIPNMGIGIEGAKVNKDSESANGQVFKGNSADIKKSNEKSE